jgi:DNA-binding MarR family transcriptional regulator/GNAT superfamily N-acetyltransferase
MNVIPILRKFTQTYTAVLGLLNNQIFNSPLSLTESRVIYEIANSAQLTAIELCQRLSLDKGYLSKILKSLKKSGFIFLSANPADKRSSILALSEEGKALIYQMDEGSNDFYSHLLNNYSPFEKYRLTKSTGEALQLLSKEKNKPNLNSISIRTELKPGDLGWIIQSHGELYDLDFQFGLEFEKYVATSITEYWQMPAPNRNAMWICEHNLNRVGYIMLLDRGDAAQLRYFFIYPEYRGIGLGTKLMNLFMSYYKAQNFASCYLWTAHQLTDAAGLYQKYGFKLTEKKDSYSFGIELREQKYELLN